MVLKYNKRRIPPETCNNENLEKGTTEKKKAMRPVQGLGISLTGL